MGTEIGAYAMGDVIPGSYDVINTSRGGRQRPTPQQRVADATTAKGSRGRRKIGIKLLTFVAGTITAFGIAPAIPGVRSSGLLRTAVSLGASAIASKVSQGLKGAPGTFAYGVAFGSALVASYEGWDLLGQLNKSYQAFTTPSNYAKFSIIGVGPVGGTFESGLWWMPFF